MEMGRGWELQNQPATGGDYYELGEDSTETKKRRVPCGGRGEKNKKGGKEWGKNGVT